LTTAALLLGVSLIWVLLEARSPTEEPSVPSAATSDRPVLVVLPLRDLGPEPEPFVSASLTVEITARLGQMAPDRLAVLAPTAAERYRDREAPLSEIASELGVDFIIEGSLSRSRDRVRVRILLVRAGDETLLMSEEVEGGTGDLFALQRAVADRAAQVLAKEILGLEAAPEAEEEVAPEAYRAFLRGRYFLDQRTSNGLMRAVESFREAIGIDEGFARAHAGLAQAYALFPSYGLAMPSDTLPVAKEEAERALKLSPNLSEAHTALGWVRWTYLGDPEAAERSFRRATELNANDATAWQWQAGPLVAMGHFDEALAAMNLALERDPLSLVLLTGRGWVSFYARRYDEAARYCQEAWDLQPAFAYAWQILAQARAQQGRFDEALNALDRSLALEDQPAVHLDRIDIQARSGDREGAEKAMRKLLEDDHRAYLPPFRLALVYESLGRRQEALRWLRTAASEMAYDWGLAAVDPRLDPLRDDPEFSSLKQKGPAQADGESLPGPAKELEGESP
ncbi:MAG: tetratricopeptide repeat protein, partial [Acidobacteria bacterium]|nr:tetratricopeptide repeat protein [Acidobacteriota bacterium]